MTNTYYVLQGITSDVLEELFPRLSFWRIINISVNEVKIMSAIIYLAFCVLVALFASRRGRSPILWGLFSLLLSPLLAAISIAIMKDLTAAQQMERNSLETDRLKERVAVSEAEIRSRMDHMEHRIDRIAYQEDPSCLPEEEKKIVSAKDENTEYCHECGEKTPIGAEFCPHCGAKLHKEAD